eukprot:scaffold57067_cov27-Phaeocystis_antarctica.AAC.1
MAHACRSAYVASIPRPPCCRAPPVQARFARSGPVHYMTATCGGATFATCPHTASGSPRAPCDHRRPSCSPAPRPSCPSCRETSWKCAGASPAPGGHEMQVAARGVCRARFLGK